MNGCMSFIIEALVFSEEVFLLALYTGACAGLLALAVLAVNVFFRRWFSARQMGLLWGLVLLRLLVPFAPASPVSLQNLLPAEQSEPDAPRDLTLQAPNDAELPRGYSAAPRPGLDSETDLAREAAPMATAPPNAIVWLEDRLPLIWLTGAAATLVWTMLAHWGLCRRLKCLTPCDDQRICGLWEACCRQAGVRRNLRIAMFEGLQRPAVAGLFRPQLLLPDDADALDDRQLRMIMLHELAHVRRWHVAANWALALIRAIHWWNPVFWLAASRFHSLREQSCDAFAIQRLEGRPTRDYSELLLMLAQRPMALPRWRIDLSASLLGFWSPVFRKHSLHNRLKALKSAGAPRSRWHAAAVAGLIGAAALGGFTDASEPEPPPPDSEWRLGTDRHWGRQSAAIEGDPGPEMTRVYNIEQALRRIAAAEKAADSGHAQLEWHVVDLVERLERRGFTHPPMISPSGRAEPSTPKHRRPARERVTVNGGELTVQAPLHVHAELARNLQAWERSGLGQTCLETRFITAEQDITTAQGISWQYVEAFSGESQEELPAGSDNGMPVVRAKAIVDDYLPITVARLNADEAAALVRVVQYERTANILQAPKVTLFNGQQTMVFDCTQTPFVIGIRDGATGVPEPKIVVIDEGIKLTLRTIQSRDAARVQLEGRIELSEINEVRTASTTLRNQPTAIQLPRVKRCRIDINSEVEDGQSLLIGCIPGYERKKFFYVLLTATNLKP